MSLLINPNLLFSGGPGGTPTSPFVLTNGTGLPLTTGVTGVLPIANGGTAGATPTASSANLGLIYAYKTADLSRASNTNSAIDNHLAFTAEASGIYAVEITAFVTVVSSTPNIKCGLNSSQVPTAAVQQVDCWGTTNIGTASFLFLTGGVSLGILNTGTNYCICIRGTLENVASNSTVGFHWAQDTSSVDAVVVKRGSYLLARKMN